MKNVSSLEYAKDSYQEIRFQKDNTDGTLLTAPIIFTLSKNKYYAA